jgi:hypothetical protein|tara:strand:- start:27 stop:251 length:225 start_codon:yes stop_codon:yes gene_type:complete
MTEPKEQLIENLKKQIQSKQLEKLDRQYVYAIQQVIRDKFPNEEKPLTFISGSSNIYDIDNIEKISNKYTPYLA